MKPLKITKCPHNEKCIWVGAINLAGTSNASALHGSRNVYFNKSTLQHICEHLHPDETEEDVLVRIGVYDTIY